METTVDLGFLEECEPWLLANKFFPSKVGGRPAWLDVERLPSPDDLKCSRCGDQTTFLCQVYAPLDEYEHCFHRTIFVFICTNSSCWQANSAKNIIVLRSQLPRENKFYDFEPPNENAKSQEVKPLVRLCVVCGCRGPQACGKCKVASYCCVKHQKIDWTLGEHKQACETVSEETIQIGNPKHEYLFDEFELVTESEKEAVQSDKETSEQKEARRLQEYEKFRKEHPTDGELKDVSEEEFQKYSSQIDEDATFEAFQQRIASDKEQVLRFDRKGQPLWITDTNKLDAKDVPDCEQCHSKRIFEFQIMPQLLNSLNYPDLDWGIIAVYTCEKSCKTNTGYTPEFAYKQDFMSNSTEGQAIGGV